MTCSHARFLVEKNQLSQHMKGPFITRGLNKILAKQNFALKNGLIKQIYLIRQSNNYHKRENANRVKMTMQ